eukprot:Cvel_25638.t2-p1 / transcript=Cvel_25638.t2 / gene=Cvel_25638 / organism=Chromera_velia_CCMP2878 / gene_product=hypothetical protein / transcript_product=hypothetical protein / location=Cvel_scaffold2932:945-3395(-) / protein_length=131 / sequence_SO=supercontig / SO=protein_coding / is_pseudo=false
MMGMKTSRPTWVGEIGGGGGDRLAWESLDLRSNVDRVKEQKQEECEASRREVDQVKQLQVQALVDSLSIATTALQNEDAKRAEALMDAEEARALVRQVDCVSLDEKSLVLTVRGSAEGVERVMTEPKKILQ